VPAISAAAVVAAGPSMSGRSTRTPRSAASPRPIGLRPIARKVEACELLEVADVEEQLGMLGPVREGEVNPVGCLWPIGRDTRLSGLDLQFLFHPADELAAYYPEGSPEAALADVRLVPEVPGVGDEALLSYGTLYVRSGEIVFSLSLESFAGASDYAAALVPLAQQLVANL
jgi:hypothetical protein